MSNQLVIERPISSRRKLKDPVIPTFPVNRQSGKLQQAISKKEMATELPLFHTAPIFKPKKHDFL